MTEARRGPQRDGHQEALRSRRGGRPARRRRGQTKAPRASNQKIMVTILSIITLPLFFDISSQQFTLVRLFSRVGPAEGGAEFHVSVVMIAFLAVLAFLRRLGGKGSYLFGGGLIGWLLFLYSAAILVGLMQGAGMLGVAFYVQTIAPLLAWYAAGAGRISVRSASLTIVAATLVSVVLVLFITFSRSGGLQGSYEVVSALVSVIPQYRNYFPFIVVCGLAMAVAGWDLHRKISLALLASTGLALPLIWSRSGLALMVVAIGIAFFLRPGRASNTTRTLLGVTGGSAVAFLTLESILSGVIGARSTIGSTAAESGYERLVLAQEGIKRIVARPLFGDAFVPYSNVLAGGQRVDIARLFPAHNQYLDIALRGGVAAAILTIVLLIVFGRRSWRLARRSPSRNIAAFHAGLLAIVVATALGNFTQLFLIQPWSGALVFALMGVSSACPSDVVSTIEAPQAWARPHSSERPATLESDAYRSGGSGQDACWTSCSRRGRGKQRGTVRP